ncbi:MAG: homogentisate 1,2-dioxygenase [Hyphomicrobiales bacterium]
MASNEFFSFPVVEGQASRQAHCDLPEGTFEREMGKEGFFGPACHMYHTHPPTGWTSWEGPLKPRAFDLNNALKDEASPWNAGLVLGNASVKMRIWYFDGKMDHLVRNGDGDELLFVHRGTGHLYCDYGHLEFAQGDYIVLPRSTSWRVETSGPVEMLLIECTNGSYKTPDRGMVGKHAVYDQAIMDTPKIDEAFKDQYAGNEEWQVRIKRLGELSTVTYPFNPLDAVGWHGDLTPVRLNVKDIRPLMSHRYHLPPSAHTTFVGNRFVICTFVPRPFESDPGALKVPFFHNNDDYDEVLFYHDGDFFSRDNIHPGMVTWHPCGFTHGPHPKALQAMYEQKNEATSEYAVMLDTRDGLEMGSAAESTEVKEYSESWLVKDGPIKAPNIPRQAAE